MKQLVTQGIVLSRTNYGEADRIMTFLTPDSGKLRLMARGSRRIKSKLAGGIELFSVSDITYITGKGDIGTLISARLNHYFAKIVSDIERVQLGYEILKRTNRVTEDHPESAYFDLLRNSLSGLNDAQIALDIIQTWFEARLLKLAGHEPNLRTDDNQQSLEATAKYDFNFDAMCFTKAAQGRWQANHIKALRLLFDSVSLQKLSRIEGSDIFIKDLQPLLRSLSVPHE